MKQSLPEHEETMDVAETERARMASGVSASAEPAPDPEVPEGPKRRHFSAEYRLRILREADRGERTIQAICQEANISEVTFHRWKKQFGHMEVNEARRLKELERENTERKKMLAEELLRNRVLSYVCEKKL